jgi:uncharacterized protein
MRFEWGEQKDAANQRKHGLGFASAALVFDDPDVVLRKDRVVDAEQRWHAIGAVQKAVLLVVHTYREERENGEEIIRIASAREASRRERRIYIQQTAD